MIKNILRRISIKAILAGAVTDYIVQLIAAVPLWIMVYSKIDASAITTSDDATKAWYAIIYGDPFILSALSLVGIIADVVGGYVAAKVAKHDELLNGLVALAPWLFFAAVYHGMGHNPSPLWLSITYIAATPLFGLLGGALCLAWRQDKISANLPVSICVDQTPTISDVVNTSKNFLQDLLGIICAGIKSLFFVRTAPERWKTSVPLLTSLFCLILIISDVAEYFEEGIGSTFYVWNLPWLLATPTIIMASVLPYYLMRRPAPNYLLLPTILAGIILVFAALVRPIPWIIYNEGWSKNIPNYILQGSGYCIELWLCAAFLVSARRRLAPMQEGGIALLLYAFIMIFTLYYFPPRGLWHAPENKEKSSLSAEDSKRRDLLFSGDILQLEPKIYNDAIAAIRHSSPTHGDMYFIGVAPSSYQDIFMKEVRTIEDLFANNFNTKGRSLLLINSLHTLDTVPLATSANIRQALKDVGQRMDKKNDVLVLYLTSHGSKKDGLSMQMHPFYKMKDIDPASLKSMLDDSGIVWRIVIISGCYSGVFIPVLQNDHTLVMTASDANHTSFGCSNDGDMTDFPKALIVDHLAKSHDFINSFTLAKKDIADEEKKTDRTVSNPQIYVGKDTPQELKKLSKNWKKPSEPIAKTAN